MSINIFSLLFGGKRKLKTRNRNGYAQYKDKDGNWQYTHRRVAEKKIGGKIGEGRVVHHKDGNKSNNQPSNLSIMRKSEHSKVHYRQQKTKKRWWGKG